ncbi:glycoside hydrolase family 30 protein [Pelagicoccus albus]|uniref:Glucan endo-1,6-beta-glucosidase n=1 Tax=Pelagicoccus albus TaxID=415222 RepID=A0A7X1B7N2_9BACT|nr:glycoside hydrolase family 30 beta sandwich domain-containing protein [Pelagicoccus albus]MBC2607081.1 glucan endo-1,6-beta-glucosidase [Pelagicoccus albus]
MNTVHCFKFLRVGAFFSALISSLSAETSVEVWVTDEDLERRLDRLEDVSFNASEEDASLVVSVDESQVYQEIDGWGVSLTGASSWLLTEQLSQEKREEVMENLFGPEGIGLTMLRQTMGASDFNREIYSYSDGEADPDLDRFSIDPDREYILPRLKEALAINPQVKVMASPWSPPGWMKTSGNMIGGTLSNEHYQSNADYFVRFIQAYEAEGIPIYAVTPQNEPGYSPAHYPGMILTKTQQIRFIGENLGPTLEASGLGRVKIICHDHNYDGVDIPRSILASSAGEYVAGSGFHHYGGPIQAMSELQSEYPEKGIWFTEGGFGEWNDHFDNMAHEMIEIPRNWAKAIVLWNAALDENSGPSVIGDDNPNEGMLMIRSDQMNQVTYHAQYYLLGHLSKFVRPGAVRIASPSWIGDVETVAFRNLDGSKVLVAANRSYTDRSIRVEWMGESFGYALPARSMMTFRWNETGPDWYTRLEVTRNRGESSGFLCEIEIDTSKAGPMFDVEQSFDFGLSGWSRSSVEKIEELGTIQKWIAESEDGVSQAFFRVNRWR